MHGQSFASMDRPRAKSCHCALERFPGNSVGKKRPPKVLATPSEAKPQPPGEPMAKAKAKTTKSKSSESRVRGVSIEQLYEAFEKAHAAYLIADKGLEEPREARALKKCDNIGRRIASRSAADIREMLLKIKIAGWFVDGVSSLEKLENWTPMRFRKGEELDVLVSLRDDIRRLWV